MASMPSARHPNISSSCMPPAAWLPMASFAFYLHPVSWYMCVPISIPFPFRANPNGTCIGWRSWCIYRYTNRKIQLYTHMLSMKIKQEKADESSNENYYFFHAFCFCLIKTLMNSKSLMKCAKKRIILQSNKPRPYQMKH